MSTKKRVVGLDADIRRLLVIYNRQIRIYRLSQSALLRRIERQLQNPEWVMPKTVREEMESLDGFLAKATRSMLELKAATSEAKAGLDTDALTAQLKAEFLRSVSTWDAEDWAVVERAQLERGALRTQMRDKGMLS